MSPEIRVNGKLVASVPDKTGLHQALDGTPLYVDLDKIDAYQKRQPIIVEGSSVGGRRIVGLTLEGRGNAANRKRGGDGKQPNLEVTLHDRPIRISYSDKIWVEHTRTLAGPNGGYYKQVKRTYRNPRWVRGREQR